MLSELAIKNFAIIDELTISFEKGLTVLTGETGAGKSIIIDAIHLLVGGRGSSEFVRHGEAKAEIEGLFLIDDINHRCIKKLTELGIEIEDRMVVLRRDISNKGKSVCRVNGKLVTISTLREIGGTLVDIHGQHEHQQLMDESFHLSLLDEFGGEKIKKSLLEYTALYTTYENLMKKLAKLTENEQQTVHRLDLLKFQYDEIENAQLQLNEDEQLTKERNELNNFERIFEALQTCYNALQGEQRGLDWIGLAMSHLENISQLSDDYKEMLEAVSNSFYIIEDVSHTVRSQLEELAYNPERLNEIESRLTVINQLKRKYGQTIESILEYSATIEEEIEMLENRESHIDQLEKKIVSVKKDLQLEANQLTDLRKQCSEKLTKAIHAELKELYMEKTIFNVHFQQEKQRFTRTGVDQVEFYLSTNPGEPLKPLSKIASGGELSRIMLALKNIFSKHQGVTSIIFDEVDTGVSGRVAQAIAEKIYQVSSHSQVFCISHLPQVAAMADTHLFIAKKVEDKRTFTTVTTLNHHEKITEIGRMISGVEITNVTTEHAKELLQLAHELKK